MVKHIILKDARSETDFFKIKLDLSQDSLKQKSDSDVLIHIINAYKNGKK